MRSGTNTARNGTYEHSNDNHFERLQMKYRNAIPKYNFGFDFSYYCIMLKGKQSTNKSL
jgi:hypothetical protein